MANGINLPKTNISSKGDLITIIQNGVKRNITKADLLGYLERSLSSLNNQVVSTNGQVSQNSISNVSPAFSGTVSAKDPSAPSHLATKRYVDTQLDASVKADGSTLLNFPLSYRTTGGVFKDTDVVPKNYIDSKLRQTLKTVIKIQGNSSYPSANVGDTFLLTSFSSSFAANGPEIQAGDILLCIEASEGGTHGEVGHQFAIINTNVVFASEESAGILRVASEGELATLNTNESSITPLKYKRALEVGSEHARTIVNTPTYSISNETKGIIGVDCRYNTVVVTLPQISNIINSEITKYIIKDEYLAAGKNNITIAVSGDNTIQGSRRTVIKTPGGAIKLYNDGGSQWFIENTSSTGSESSSAAGVSITTDDISNGEMVIQVTGASEFVPVMSVDVDLKDYPIGTGFKVVMASMTAGTVNNKGTAIGINGFQFAKSSLTGTANPSTEAIVQEVTILHSNTSAYFAFGSVSVGQDATAVAITNGLSLNWDTTVTISADVNAPTATTDVSVYALQIIPLK